MAECKETVATMLDVQVQTAGGYAAAAKRGEAARPSALWGKRATVAPPSIRFRTNLDTANWLF